LDKIQIKIKKMAKKVFIHHFHCLNNYGSAMMGLITLNELQKRYGKDTVFYCQCNGYSSFEEIQSELAQPIQLRHHQSVNPVTSRFKWIRSLQKRKYLVDASEVKGYDEVIILGGDDLSEYYTTKIYRELLKYWRWSKSVKVVLLGQSIGPFSRPKNKMVMKYLYHNIPIFVRDYWSKKYLKEAFNLDKNIIQGADLAFLDLPLQSDTNIEKEILKKYHLIPQKYISIVISGLQGKYYTSDKNAYYKVYKNLINNILNENKYKDFKIILLAHTFPPHGNESELINDFLIFSNLQENDRVIAVTDKILPTRARFILGNGLMTVTGRMHAAISTLQMGKPAIALSYSAKYKGVIGMNLNRNDLIIESNKPSLWNESVMTQLIWEKINYVFQNYEQISREIKQKVEEQKQLVLENFDLLTKMQ